jgi:amidase
MKGQSRRDFVIAAGAIAITGAIAKDSRTNSAFAQKQGSIAGADWDYRTTKDLVDALQGRKISAVELTDRVIERVGALDPRLNAVVVHDFDRARDAAKAADMALARGERQPLLGIPMVVKESFNVTGYPRRGGFRQPRAGYQRKMRSRSPASRRRAPLFSVRPMCRSSWATGRATTTSTERPTIPGI